jgi:predicted Zn-dependent peptidase
MKKPAFVFLLCLICLLPTLIASQTMEDIVTEFTLDNGMEFVIVERHVAPVFFGAIAFKVGSINEWDGVTGISHLLEHMMFKGTTTVGTRSYVKEKKYMAREDEIAAEMGELRREIGPWRFEIFEDFSRHLISSLDEEKKQEMGSDRALGLSALVSLLEAGEGSPPEAEFYPTLVQDGDTDYLDLYLKFKRKELGLEALLVEHRDLIISEELWDAYLQNGARMVNAFTSNDVTAYVAYMPANRIELWMMLESDRMKDPVFREFYSERNVVAEERRLGENDPESELYDALMATAFQASPYRRSVIGWMSDIQSITKEELEAYHKRFYAPNNAVAFLVGDLDPDEMEKMARKYFGKIEAQEPPPPIETVEPEQKGERRITLEFPSNPDVMIGYHVPVPPHPDAYAIDVLKSVLGDGRTSRFYKRIYEELELTSRAPDIAFEPGMKLDNLFTIHAVPRHPHTTEDVEKAIYEEIERIKTEPPTDREIQRIRNRIDAQLVRVLGSNFGLAFTVGMSVMMRDSWRAFLDDAEMKKLVEPEDVSRMAARYLTPSNRTVATLVKAEEEDEESGESEEIDMRAIMEWVRTLPQEEQMEMFQRVQSMTEEQRMEYARELMERMKAEQE